MEWNYSLSLMTFSISLPNMFNSTIEQKDLGKLYNDLFSFRMIIDVDVLKCDGQCPRFIQTLAMLIMKFKQSSLLIILLKSLQEILPSPKANKLLYLLMVVLSSFFKNRYHSEISLDCILSKILMLI